MTSTDDGIRFIDNVSAEPPAVRQAIERMIEDMRAERAEESVRLAEAKAGPSPLWFRRCC